MMLVSPSPPAGAVSSPVESVPTATLVCRFEVSDRLDARELPDDLDAGM
jgi:hypothetical protein